MNRSAVHRASTYRARDREPDCAFCGRTIRSFERWEQVEDPSFGGVSLPVHVDCEGSNEDEQEEPPA